MKSRNNHTEFMFIPKFQSIKNNSLYLKLQFIYSPLNIKAFD